MAVASAGLYASLHLAPDKITTPVSPPLCFLQPFLPPNQQRQSTEGTISSHGWQFQISEAETVQLMTTEFPDDHAEDHGSPVTTRSPAMTTILKFEDLQFVSGVASTKKSLRP